MGSDRLYKGSSVTALWPQSLQMTCEDSTPPNSASVMGAAALSGSSHPPSCSKPPLHHGNARMRDLICWALGKVQERVDRHMCAPHPSTS